MAARFDRSVAYLNRNPLNIRWSAVKWRGQTGRGRGGFVEFESFTYGYRAAVVILRSYHLRGIRSIRDIIATWAPRTENDTDAYIATAINTMNGFWSSDTDDDKYCSRTQINLRDREMVVKLLYAMTKVEMGANVAQLHEMKSYMFLGYDLAVTRNRFFNGID